VILSISTLETIQCRTSHILGHFLERYFLRNFPMSEDIRAVPEKKKLWHCVYSVRRTHIPLPGSGTRNFSMTHSSSATANSCFLANVAVAIIVVRPSVVCLSVTTLTRLPHSVVRNHSFALQGLLSRLKFSVIFLCHLLPWPSVYAVTALTSKGKFSEDRHREPRHQGGKRKRGSQIMRSWTFRRLGPLGNSARL